MLYLFPVFVVFQIFDLLLGSSARSFHQLHLEFLSLLSRYHDAWHIHSFITSKSAKNK